MAIRYVVVYYALDAHEFIAGIKCRHCKSGMLLSVCQLGLGVEGIYGWGCHTFKSSIV